MADQIEKRNERHLLQQVFPLRTPYIMLIDPSGACNFSCNFCPCNRSDYLVRERHTIMDMQLFCRVVDEIKCFPNRLKVIYLYGFGEPLLNPHFCEMVQLIKKEQICDEVRTVTNGSLLTSELNEKLVESGIDLIRISVEALHEKDYYSMCGVNLNFNDFVNNIEDLYEKSRKGNTKISVKIVSAMLKTQNDIDKFHSIFDKIADYVYIEDVEDQWADFENIVLPQDNLSVNNGTCNIRSRSGGVCTECMTHMVVHANGRISACCSDWKYGTEYGNLADSGSSLVAFWNSPELKKFWKLHLEHRRGEHIFCKDCKKRSLDNVDEYTDIMLKRLGEV